VLCGFGIMFFSSQERALSEVFANCRRSMPHFE
jgi:hypothetical protein